MVDGRSAKAEMTSAIANVVIDDRLVNNKTDVDDVTASAGGRQNSGEVKDRPHGFYSIFYMNTEPTEHEKYPLWGPLQN